MKITPDLANAIVQRAIKIIKNALNVMDEHGYIIASTDHSRLHQRHEGAILALSEKRTIEITDEMQHNMWGVKPGVNLPIFFKDQAIGVIGISGRLEDVRQYGELVRMAAEMTVEHAHELELLRWSETRKEEFVQQWLQYETNEDHLRSIAAKLNVNMDTPYGIVLLQHPIDIDQRTITKQLSQINPHILKASCNSMTLVILLPLQGKKQETLHTHWEKSKKRLLKEMKSTDKYRWVFSTPAHSIGGVRSAFSGLCSLLNGLPENVHLANISDYPLAALLNPISETWQLEQVEIILQAITDKNPVLLSTLQMWFLQNSDIDKAASSLSIHPNTVRYRLRQVEECTGFELTNFQHKGLLYAALTIRPTSQWIVNLNKK
ncbi:CdaR family transcriptional regulator [Grimontia sp. NTOU-MAR1]|uniref:CdaR family transcriptional regulator n=1 Tax=Grimontia sp. NTOU-MAR1 TaxID=3111011 RepID=UPI002DB7FF80|nr:sugar diacid recognition domain-containing protein [Grimontia sp. NTOU-MAR1]WRV97086.1 sugar diacid recognition domain-containing protein [Grimontia sp. NTOU-MAR1]